MRKLQGASSPQTNRTRFQNRGRTLYKYPHRTQGPPVTALFKNEQFRPPRSGAGLLVRPQNRLVFASGRGTSPEQEGPNPQPPSHCQSPARHFSAQQGRLARSRGGAATQQQGTRPEARGRGRARARKAVPAPRPQFQEPRNPGRGRARRRPRAPGKPHGARAPVRINRPSRARAPARVRAPRPPDPHPPLPHPRSGGARAQGHSPLRGRPKVSWAQQQQQPVRPRPPLCGVGPLSQALSLATSLSPLEPSPGDAAAAAAAAVLPAGPAAPLGGPVLPLPLQDRQDFPLTAHWAPSYIQPS